MTVLKRALLASAFGSVFGVLIGLVSIYRYPPSVPKSRASAASVPSTPVRGAAAPAQAAGTAAATPNIDADDVVRRARALASQPDVRGLMTLREETTQQAVTAGRADDPLTKARIAEIDRALNQARALRLVLDREEFLKQGEPAKARP